MACTAASVDGTAASESRGPPSPPPLPPPPPYSDAGAAGGNAGEPRSRAHAFAPVGSAYEAAAGDADGNGAAADSPAMPAEPPLELPSFTPLRVPLDGDGYVVSFVVRPPATPAAADKSSGACDAATAAELRRFFHKYGFVVVRDVLSPAQSARTLDEVWLTLEGGRDARDGGGSGVCRWDPATWGPATWPRGASVSNGMTRGEVVCTPQFVANRGSPAVAAPFAVLLRTPMRGLVASADRCTLFRATHVRRGVAARLAAVAAGTARSGTGGIGGGSSSREASQPNAGGKGEGAGLGASGDGAEDGLVDVPEWRTRLQNLHVDINPVDTVFYESRVVAARAATTYSSPRHLFMDAHNAVASECGGVALQGVLNLVDNRSTQMGTRFSPRHTSRHGDPYSPPLHSPVSDSSGGAVAGSRSDFAVGDGVGFGAGGDVGDTEAWPPLHEDGSAPVGLSGEDGGFVCVPGFHHAFADWVVATQLGACGGFGDAFCGGAAFGQGGRRGDAVWARSSGGGGGGGGGGRAAGGSGAGGKRRRGRRIHRSSVFKFGGTAAEAHLVACAQRISCRAGSIIVFDARLPHGSRPNHSDRVRAAQFVTYRPEAHVPQQHRANRSRMVLSCVRAGAPRLLRSVTRHLRQSCDACSAATTVHGGSWGHGMGAHVAATTGATPAAAACLSLTDAGGAAVGAVVGTSVGASTGGASAGAYTSAGASAGTGTSGVGTHGGGAAASPASAGRVSVGSGGGTPRGAHRSHGAARTHVHLHGASLATHGATPAYRPRCVCGATCVCPQAHGRAPSARGSTAALVNGASATDAAAAACVGPACPCSQRVEAGAAGGSSSPGAASAAGTRKRKRAVDGSEGQGNGASGGYPQCSGTTGGGTASGRDASRVNGRGDGDGPAVQAPRSAGDHVSMAADAAGSVGGGEAGPAASASSPVSAASEPRHMHGVAAVAGPVGAGAVPVVMGELGARLVLGQRGVDLLRQAHT